MDVRLLGPLEVFADDGTPIDLGGPKPRAFVALLALRANELMASERIIDVLWGGDDLRDRANALQALVSKLRRSWTAGLPAGEVCPIVTRGVGYALEVDPEVVDTVRFERLVGIGRARIEVGDVDEASARLSEALGLWRGPALAEFEYDEFAVGDRARLEDLRLAAIEQRIVAELARGRHELLTGEIEGLITAHPLREKLRGQLMLALYRSGRQADALRAYQDTRDVLAEGLGLDPGPELQRLEAQILEQAPELDLDPVATTPTVPRLASVAPGNLPSSVSSFIGRATERDDTVALVRDHRLVTLTGPGGVGKTRLALEVAGRCRSEHTDGVWLVELAPVVAPATIEGAIAAALGVEAGEALVDHLAPRGLLLIMDNCEHLVEETAVVVDRLLRTSAGLRILATSRERLGVAGERSVALAPMTREDAVALFVERAQAGGLDTEGAAAPVAALCGQLDDLPLAVELAAARTRTLSIEDITVRLHDRFAILTGGDRTAEPRQRTLRSVVDWSYDLLFADEQRLFRRLSVFNGGFGGPAAEVVGGGDDLAPDEVLELLGNLVDKSLVTVVGRDGPTRYELLQTLVDYGRARLAEAGEEEATRRRHRQWMAAFAGRSVEAFRGAEQGPAFAAMAAERANLLSALQQALDEQHADDAVMLASGLAVGWYVIGGAAEAIPALDRALAVPGGTEDASRSYAVAWTGMLGHEHGVLGVEEALDRLAEARRLAGGYVHAFSSAAVFASRVLADLGRVQEAEALLDEADAVIGGGSTESTFFNPSERWTRAAVDWARAELALQAGSPASATVLLRRSLAGFDAEQDALGKALCAPLLGELAAARGDFEEAEAVTRSAYAKVSEVGATGFLLPLLAVRLGNLAAQQDRFDEAEEWHRSGLVQAREGRHHRVIAEALNGMGRAALRAGRLDDAEADHEAALAEFAAMDSDAGQSLTLVHLAAVAVARPDREHAAALLLSSIRLAAAVADRSATALAVERLADVRSGEGTSAADDLRSLAADLTADPPIPDLGRDRLEELLAGTWP